MASKRSNKPSPVSVAYAQSLLELADEQQQAESIGQELDALAKILDENPAAVEDIFANPAVGVEERGQLLQRVFRNNVSDLLYRTLAVMNDRGRLGLIRQMAEAYDDLLSEKLGKVEVDLIVAQRLDNDQLEQARQKISQALKRDAIVHQYVDENILGGVVIRVGDKLIDASVRYQLQAMRNQLLAAAPK
jgi:F-type H+-transporting ATPase subunit delta